MIDKPVHHRYRWGYALNADEAAEYCGVSRSGFLRAVAANEAPASISPTRGRRVWLRRALEEWLDRLASPPCHNPFALPHPSMRDTKLLAPAPAPKPMRGRRGRPRSDSTSD